jgi:hypothetical protein
MRDFLVFSTVRLVIALLYALALVAHLLHPYKVKSKNPYPVGSNHSDL